MAFVPRDVARKARPWAGRESEAKEGKGGIRRQCSERREQGMREGTRGKRGILEHGNLG